MSELKLDDLKKVAEYDSQVDSGRRITLRKRKDVKAFDHYHTTVFEDGTVLLRPRVLVAPELAIEKSTLQMIDESIQNAKAKKLGDTFDLDDFKELLSEKDE